MNRPNCPGSGFPWDRLFNDLNEGVNKMAEQWQTDLVTKAKDEGLINGDHDALEDVPFWMLCAVAISIKKAIINELKG